MPFARKRLILFDCTPSCSYSSTTRNLFVFSRKNRAIWPVYLLNACEFLCELWQPGKQLHAFQPARPSTGKRKAASPIGLTALL